MEAFIFLRPVLEFFAELLGFCLLLYVLGSLFINFLTRIK